MSENFTACLGDIWVSSDVVICTRCKFRCERCDYERFTASMNLTRAIEKEAAAENRMIEGDFDDFEEADKNLALLGREIDSAYKALVEIFQ